jgi:hypothetical protein
MHGDELLRGRVDAQGDALNRMLLSDAEFAALTGKSEVDVREAVSRGLLLAVQRSKPDGSCVESGIAGFQARPEIDEAAVSRIMSALHYERQAGTDSVNAADAYMFFTSVNELMGGLTPVEALTGVAPAGCADSQILEFLAKPYAVRLEFIVQLASATADRISGWR